MFPENSSVFQEKTIMFGKKTLMFFENIKVFFRVNAIGRTHGSALNSTHTP